MTDSDKKSEKPTTYKTTLGELGNQLPVGQNEQSVLYKVLEVKPWKLKNERELGELRDKHREANLAQYISMVLGSMCTSFGATDLSSMSMSDKRARMGRMYMGDMFYAYMWLRCSALGAKMDTNLSCPSCAAKFKAPIDLNSTEVICAKDAAALDWVYTLLDPIEVQGTRVTRFDMGPARWRTLEGADFNSGLNTGAAKSMIIRGSIVKMPELERGSFSEDDLDELSKRDLETITRAIDEHSIGPDMSIETQCLRCRSDMKVSLDWGFDSFFSISSPSER